MEKSKEEIRKAAFDFIDAWINKKYAGAKELGDWTTEEVADLMNDYARQMAEKLPALVDLAWNEATDSNEVPSTEWSNRLINQWLTDQGLSPRSEENDKHSVEPETREQFMERNGLGPRDMENDI